MRQLVVLGMFWVLSEELAKMLDCDWLRFFEQFTHYELIIGVESPQNAFQNLL
jgi:hypothetical protein